MRLVIIVFLLLPFSTYASYFASIKSEKANMRIGPSANYPIEWVYIQKNLPIKIVERYDQWRSVQDIEGTKGWMHKSLLSSKQYFFANGEQSAIYKTPNSSSKIKAYMENKVIGKVLKCNGKWCKIQIENIQGWMLKENTWGIN